MIEKDHIKIAGLNRGGEWLVICDHASCDIPREFNGFSLSTNDCQDHMAWDIGAWQLSVQLAKALNAPVVGGVISRLVVDLNRYPEDKLGSMPAVSDGVIIQDNYRINEKDRQERLDRWFYPYHDELSTIIAGHNGGRPKLLFVHSFTPSLRTEQVKRPWHIGFISDKNRNLTDRALTYLAKSPWIVGDNEPYAPINPDSYCLPEHAEKNGYDYLVIEMRNDLINDDEGINQWCSIINDTIHHIDNNTV